MNLQSLIKSFGDFFNKHNKGQKLSKIIWDQFEFLLQNNYF